MSGDNTLTVPLLNNFFNAEITIQCSGLYYLRTLYKPSLFNINTESMLGFLYFYRLYAIVYGPVTVVFVVKACRSLSIIIVIGSTYADSPVRICSTISARRFAVSSFAIFLIPHVHYPLYR